MSAISGVSSNNVNMIIANSETVATDAADDSSKEVKGKYDVTYSGVGQVPVASNKFGLTTLSNEHINPNSAEARNIWADEFHTSTLSGHSATRLRSSIGHDDAYFKTDGKISNPAVGKDNLSGYDVNTADDKSSSPNGNNIRVKTHGGQEMTDYIAGTSVREGELMNFADGSSGGLSVGAEMSNEMIGGSIRYGNIMVDGRYNFADGLGLGTQMGDMAGAGVGSLRYLFAPNKLLQGAVGVTAGHADDGGIFALGGHANSHFFDGVAHTKLGDLQFSVDAQNKFVLPFKMGEGQDGDFLKNMSLSSLLTVGAEYHANEDWTFGTKLNSNIDFAHMLNDISELPITNFAEISAAYSHSHFDLAGNIYVPLSVFDDNFANHVTWNVQGGFGMNIFDGFTRAGLSASVSGNMEDFSVSKVSVNADFSALSAGVTVSGIDTGDLSVGVNAKLNMTFASMVALWATAF